MNWRRKSIVPCTEVKNARPATRVAVGRLATVALALAAAACSGPADRGPGEASERRAAPSTATTPPAAAAPGVIGAAPAGEARRALAAPKTGRNWVEVRQQAAERLIAANPDITYLGRVPDRLLAIPVLEVELNGDGSVRRIEILREPREAKDTLKIAVDAVRRAAPFGDVSRLPRPWKFTETFLFDDDRKFKPRTLDH
jgi:hypothetical protein